MSGLFDFLYESSVDENQQQFVDKFVSEGLSLYKKITLKQYSGDIDVSNPIQLADNWNGIFHGYITPKNERIYYFELFANAKEDCQDFYNELMNNERILKHNAKLQSTFVFKDASIRIYFVDMFNFNTSTEEMRRVLTDIGTAIYEEYNDKFYIF